VWLRKKIAVVSGLIAFTLIGISASRQPGNDPPRWKNLRIIPKTVDDVYMEALMNKYDRDLGVTCNYCHAATKPGVVPQRADFPSDDNPEKKVAREMMRMTDRINKKYFGIENTYDFDFEMKKKAAVTCRTCHRGTLLNPSHTRPF